MSAVLCGTRDPSPHARIIMSLPLVRSCLLPGIARGACPACSPERRPTSAHCRGPRMFRGAGRVARPCAPSGPDSGNIAITALRALRALSGRGLDLDMPGGVGAGSHRSRAAGQLALPPGHYTGRDPRRKQRGADGRRPGLPPRAPCRYSPPSS